MPTRVDTLEPVSFRVSAQEKAILEMLAEHDDQKPSPYVRDIVIEVLRARLRDLGGPQAVLAKNLEKRREAEVAEAAALAEMFDELPLVTDPH